MGKHAKRGWNDLAAGDFTDAFGMFLDVLFAAAARMACADQLGVVFEARRVGFAAVGVTLGNVQWQQTSACMLHYLHEFDAVTLFLCCAPSLEGIHICEYKSVAIVGITGTIWLLCGGGAGDC